MSSELCVKQNVPCLLLGLCHCFVLYEERLFDLTALGCEAVMELAGSRLVLHQNRTRLFSLLLKFVEVVIFLHRSLKNAIRLQCQRLKNVEP